MENQGIISFTYSTLLILSTALMVPYCTATNDPIGDEYVRQACSVTTHQILCIRTLAGFSGSAKTSPSRWARAGVSVTVTEANRVVLYLSGIGEKDRPMRGRNRAALSDCVECLRDAAGQLHLSLAVMRNLSKGTFEAQMGDLATWLSAALTDADTCLEGFSGQDGRRVRDIRRRVSRAGGVISNALALVNKLASTGL